MTPQLVDRAHTDSCIVICCNLVQPRRKMNMFIAGRSHIAVASQLHIIHNCEHEIARCCMTLHGLRSRSLITVTIVNNATLDCSHYQLTRYVTEPLFQLSSVRAM